VAKTATTASKAKAADKQPTNLPTNTGGNDAGSGDTGAPDAAALAAAAAAEAQARAEAEAEAKRQAEAREREEAAAREREEAERAAAARAAAEADADAAARAASRTFPRDMLLVNETAQQWVVRKHVAPASSVVIHVRHEDDLHGLRQNCLNLLKISDHYRPVPAAEGEEEKPHALRVVEIEDDQA